MVPTFALEILISGMRIPSKPSNEKFGKYILNSTKKTCEIILSIFLNFSFSRDFNLTFDDFYFFYSNDLFRSSHGGEKCHGLKCQSPISSNFHAINY